MRHASRWILCLAWFVSGCDTGSAPSPSAPTVVPPPPVLAAPHSYFNVNWRVPDVFSPIAAGDVINQRVTSEDPQCDPRYAARCQFYRYVASRDGVFEVAMAWDVTLVTPNERRVQLRVKGGSVYWVSIWSAAAPGEPFVLTASLQPD